MNFGRLLRRRCRSEVALTRAFSEGPEGDLTNHMAACPRCATLWSDLTRLRAFTRDLSLPPPDAVRVEQTRTAILASLPDHGPHISMHKKTRPAKSAGPLLLAAAATVAFAALGIWHWAPRLVRRSAPVGPAVDRTLVTFHATVRARPDAMLGPMGDTADDQVRLQHGGAFFEVLPLSAGQRFRVIAGDGEVEVRGTSFEVEVDHDHLMRVSVRHGSVAVRAQGSPETLLTAGQEWLVSRPGLPSSLPSAGETAFIEAWSAWRAGRFTEASVKFAAAVRLTGDAALAEDAAYWRAMALLRASSASATDELEAFLARYPRAAHAEDASIALAWRLLDGGRHAEARQRFRLALHAQDTSIRNSARLGLLKLRAAGP
jgi:hypothetical protein